MIQSGIEEYLTYQENMGRLIFQKNNSGAVKVNHGNRTSFIRFGKKGAPDFLIWRIKNKGLPTQHLETLFIEVKTEVGKQSEDQVKFEGMVALLGGTYRVVRSLQELIMYMEQK